MTQMAGDGGWMEVFGTVAETQVVVTEPLRGSTMHHAINWTLARRATRSDRPVKAFFAMGPVELAAVALVDEHYHDRKALLRDLADIFHAEMLESMRAGATIVELDDLIFTAPQDGLYEISMNIWQGWSGRRPRLRWLKIDGELPFDEPNLFSVWELSRPECFEFLNTGLSLVVDANFYYGLYYGRMSVGG